MDTPENLAEYLKQIGKRGGQKKSKAKAQAAKINLAKARAVLKKKRAKKSASLKTL